MTVLSSELRSSLKKAIIAARDAAEEACRAALDVLGVGVERVADHLGEDDRHLRLALRAEARQLNGFERLVEECAYEQWHRMLFARFLAENELLMHPAHAVAVSLGDCEEIARERGIADPWAVASEFASAMLPGIFRSDDPVLRLRLTPEGQGALEAILAALPTEVFTSDDGLGWVYQYWQAKKKKEVNASERKIGGADIAPVTQLFTEHYMVRFLIENTLGAWWAARYPDSPLVREWEYLRFDDEGKPAAGSFPGWPERVAEVTVMDPCCGSGHFLVTAFEMLRRMRTEAESLSAAEAGDAVLRDNLFGLELDARCTQIAAFALALQAWKTGGYRELPVPNVACSGISAAGRLEDWKRLAAGDDRLERSLERLHALFAESADLGSLIDPLRETDGDLLLAEFSDVEPLVAKALASESDADPGGAVFGAAAVSAIRALGLLARRYTIVATNPPFLTRQKQDSRLTRHLHRTFEAARADLAVAMFLRCHSFAADWGALALVVPLGTYFQPAYRAIRLKLLADDSWLLLARLGAGAFRQVSGEVVSVALHVVAVSAANADHCVALVDAIGSPGHRAKDSAIRENELVRKRQQAFLAVADARIVFDEIGVGKPLGVCAESRTGTRTGDNPQFIRCFWELAQLHDVWRPLQSTTASTAFFSGREHILRWEGGQASFRVFVDSGQASVQGMDAWGKDGVAISLTGDLKATLYTGEIFDMNTGVIWPTEDSDLAPLWSFCSSPDFHHEVRKIDQQLKLTTATLVKVPFDRDRWIANATDVFPAGLPLPDSSDPSQWLFGGHPAHCKAPLHVGVIRLVGYQWPRQTGFQFRHCPASAPDGLEALADNDGIVCLTSVRGEIPAVERLRSFLAASFGEGWSPAREADLLDDVGYAGRSLEQWMRDAFFEQHCQLFHQRPFVWQVWDGRKDGFSALVNYHQLDRAMLEKLAYAYLGDWIRQQQAASESGTPGSELRLAAAQELQGKLQLVLEGERPYDIFVRWKPIEEQPLGWEPDLNDGVRLNIRPFVNAGVLRKNPKANWNKDRGKDLKDTPWYSVFEGARINDHHLTLAEKRAAREAVERRASAP